MLGRFLHQRVQFRLRAGKGFAPLAAGSRTNRDTCVGVPDLAADMDVVREPGSVHRDDTAEALAGPRNARAFDHLNGETSGSERAGV